MPKSATGKEKRSFIVVDARRVDGCPTKFKVKGKSGRYFNNDARSACKKAFASLCNIKRIRGQCALVITMKETTQGSAGKEFTYKLRRKKLETPKFVGDITYKYKKTYVKAIKDKSNLTCKSGKGKSPGPMKSKRKKRKKVSSKTVSKSLKSTTSKSKSNKTKKKGFLGLF